MADKNFKVKNKLVIAGLTNASGVLLAEGHTVDSHTNLATQYGGTGTTTSPSSGQVLYSTSGSTYAPTTLSSLVIPISYTTSEPASPVIGQIWIDSDSSSDSYNPNLIRRQSFTATAGQTEFTTTISFIEGYEQVYFNGLLLLRTADYTTSNSNTVTLGAAAAVNDIIEVVTVTNLNSTNTYTQAEINSAISAHSSDTTSVHGIADTSVLATQSYVQDNKGINSGNTASRPDSPSNGDLYYNTETSLLEVYDSGWWTVNVVPGIPTSVVATNSGSNRAYNNGSASVAFTAATSGGKTSTYTVTSSPGSYTNTGSSSPIVITGLQSSTQYTYTVTATGPVGTSASSAASSAVTATTIPQAPTINSVTAGNAQVSVAFTANATGGSSITSYTVTSSPGNFTATGSSSPLVVTGLTNGTSYTFTATATNANGTSLASSASSSATPTIPTITADYLIVAGGGGGGTNWGEASGGGGAGGFRYLTSQTITGGSTTITVGAGGAAGTVGNNSSINSASATGGGNGANSVNANGTAGGSGGGANMSGRTGGAGNAGGYSPVEGYKGGDTTASNTNYCAGGGGGAGGAGSTGSTGGNPTGIPGGAGAANSITGASVTYAAGGSGGCGSSAGGFAGIGSTTIGGGGGGYGTNGVTRPAGQNGIVILKIPNTYTATVPGGLTYTLSTAVSGYNIYSFTAGTGTVTF